MGGCDRSRFYHSNSKSVTAGVVALIHKTVRHQCAYKLMGSAFADAEFSRDLGDAKLVRLILNKQFDDLKRTRR